MPHRIKREPAEGEEGDTTYVYSRAEDRSFWAWTAALAEKYKVLIWMGGILLIGAGFGFRTPQQVFGEINAEIDTLKTHEKRAETERHKLENKIDILLKLRCYEVIERKLEQQALLVGLNCDRVLQGEQ
jgi:hypothetical protein